MVRINSFAQTFTGGTVISDFGFGEGWTTRGFEDFDINGTLAKDGNDVDCYRFDFTAENTTLRPALSYGFNDLEYFLTLLEGINNIDFELGNMSRIYNSAIHVD